MWFLWFLGRFFQKNYENSVVFVVFGSIFSSNKNASENFEVWFLWFFGQISGCHETNYGFLFQREICQKFEDFRSKICFKSVVFVVFGSNFSSFWGFLRFFFEKCGFCGFDANFWNLGLKPQVSPPPVRQF